MSLGGVVVFWNSVPVSSTEKCGLSLCKAQQLCLDFMQVKLSHITANKQVLENSFDFNIQRKQYSLNKKKNHSE